MLSSTPSRTHLGVSSEVLPEMYPLISSSISIAVPSRIPTVCFPGFLQKFHLGFPRGSLSPETPSEILPGVSGIHADPSENTPELRSRIFPRVPYGIL